ncbi:MAG: signal recognition particle-docking protein FtsY [Lachnospiraceae bacterium]|nr:signal recognition particle-docking protein FtsY [Lachnospiraceae bacterium]
MADGLFKRLKASLTKSRNSISENLNNVFLGYSEIDEDFYEELEERLIMADLGVNATSRIMDRLRERVKAENLTHTSSCREILIEEITGQMAMPPTAYVFLNGRTVLFVIGVNGAGKTTSVGKLAALFKGEGKNVLIAAADTYRAAATEQLVEWANRADVPIITGKEGADPASVIYDAVHAAQARNIDMLIVDTAGRLHNKKNLMEELRKMSRIINKELPFWNQENLIVLDGTTGQNALSQAHEFGDVTRLTGIILTKLDGTAKGGIAIAIVNELSIPVKYIGIGEGINDMTPFDPNAYVRALFDEKDQEEEQHD